MATKKRSAKKTSELDPNLNPDDEANKPLTAKAARKVPMFVDSTIHLKGKAKGDELRVITGGVMLDELDEELTEDELDELISLKAIRPATSAEIAAADARADAEKE